MVRYLRKCSRGIGELAVMEVAPAPATATETAGVTTRARTLALRTAATAAAGKRRKAAREVAGSEGIQMSYLQLRSRSLVMTHRTGRSRGNSARRMGEEVGRPSRCSSNSSSEVAAQLRSEGRDGAEASVCESECSRDRREAAASAEKREESNGVESAGGRRSTRATAEVMPPAAEIEDFFMTAEGELQQRFISKYNFDIVNDVPLQGRYDWVRLN